MPKELEELKGFQQGIISSASTSDIPKEAATHSLNVDGNIAQGNLTGIFESKLLNTSGWREKRYSKYVLTIKDHAGAFATSVYDYKFFIWHTYNADYFVWFNDDTSVTQYNDTTARNENYQDLLNSYPGLISVKIETNGLTDTTQVATKIKDILSALGPASGGNLSTQVSQTWFTITQSTNVLTFLSNFLGVIPKIATDSSLTDAIDSTYFETSNSILGSGIMNFQHEFSWMHFVNDNVSDTLLAITKFNQLIKINDAYSLGSTISTISDSLASDGVNNISAQNRNNNLYIGTGNTGLTQSKWFGRINRKQLGENINGQFLEPAELKSPDKFMRKYDFDNVVVPTLHSGMNSTNSMIAGAASLYGDAAVGTNFGGNDVDAEDFSGDNYRSLNGWVMQCLKNAGIAFQSDGITAADDDSNFHWDSLKRGMILRVSIGDDNVDQAYSAYHAGTPASGTAVKELQRIKEFGYCDISAATAASEGMELHDGDLFQVISVPSGAATDDDALAKSYDDINEYPRLMYVGSLNGDNTDHNSTDAFVPAPAWAYAHYNNDSVIHRISLAECRDSTITSAETLNTFSTSGATGTTIDSADFNYRVTSIDLMELLPNKNFKIGTISQCLSTDGEGGIGGRTGTLKKGYITAVAVSGENVTFTVQDAASSGSNLTHNWIVGDWVTISDLHSGHNGIHQITAVPASHTFTCVTGGTDTGDTAGRVVCNNRNFYAGHGKLWVTGYLDIFNENAGKEIYLIDVLNWTGIDVNKPKIDVKRVNLNFTRIHPFLISDDNGYGLLEEFSHGNIGESSYLDRHWSPFPKDCFIGAVCETYSHQPHLDDGASNGNGTGSWRVWTAYEKLEGYTFLDWELFLYNFRPTELYKIDTNVSDSKVVHMYDKTPPYQECGLIDSDEGDAIYYPKGKFFLQNNTPFECGLNQTNPGTTTAARENQWTALSKITDSSNQNQALSTAGWSWFYNWAGDYDGFYKKEEVWNYGEGLQDLEAPDGSIQNFSHLINAGSGNTSCHLIRNAGLHLKLKNINHDNWNTYNSSSSIPSVLTESNPLSSTKMAWPNSSDPTHALGGREFGNGLFYQNPAIKDPSGYWHILESPWMNFGRVGQKFKNHRFHMGYNIGWTKSISRDTIDLSNESGNFGRSWQLERHCMIPYYNKWYWTGDGSTSEVTQDWGAHKNSSDAITDSKVAHVVQFVGKLEGNFVKDGGLLITTETDNWGTIWGLGKKSDTEVLSISTPEIYEYIMHDSPVAFSPAGTDNVTGSTLTDWSGAEVQGRPTIHTDDTADSAAKKDVKADYLTDVAVKPSLGYSGYNQYRWGHQYNGTASISTDAKTSDAIADTWNTYDGYYGQDGYGHYNMVTTTWDSTDIGFKGAVEVNGLLDEQHLGNGIHPDQVKHHRMRFHNMYWAYNWFSSDYYNTDGNFWHDTDDNGNNATYTLTDGGEGAGYFTYYANKDSHTSTGGSWSGDGHLSNTFDGFIRGHYPSNNYENGSTLSYGDLPAGTAENGLPFGTPWDSRRIITCNSVINEGTHLYHRIGFGKKSVLTNPRCTFRRLSGNFDDYDESGGWEKIKDENVYAVDRLPIFTDSCISNGFIVYSKINDSISADNVPRTKVTAYYGPVGRHGGLREPGTSYLNTLDENARPFYQSVDGNSKVVYFNNQFIGKNLCESIFHKGSDYDIYSPIIVGDTGDNKKTSINIWRRSYWATLSSTLTNLDDVTAPYYNFDRFFNAAAVDNNSHGGLDNCSSSSASLTTDLSLRFPTEAIGSHSGTNNADTDTVSGAAGDAGSHQKTTFDNFVTSEGFTSGQDGTKYSGEFEPGDILEYKFSFLYDGYQDSPLSEFTWTHPGGGTDDALNSSDFTTVEDVIATGINRIRLTIRLQPPKKMNLSKRITDIIIWRRNNNSDDYRFIEQIELNKFRFSDLNSDGEYIVYVNDKKAFESYENTTGISSTTTNTSVNYRISAQVEDYMFVADTFHPKFDDTKNVVFRSKNQGRFSMFDWTSDYLAMPERPLALASFGGKLYVFTREKLYRVNPSSLFVESVMEGVGILNQNCVVVTDYGMFFCDANNMYHHNGTEPNIISGTVAYNQDNPEWATGYKRAIARAVENNFNVLAQYDGKNHCVYFIVRGYSEGVSSYVSNKSRAFCYSIKSGRFDIMEMSPIICSTLGKDGDVLLADNHQIYSFRKSLSVKKKWDWHSKLFDMGTISVSKVWKSIKIAGSPTINNISGNSSDDILVYVDGIQKTMKLENKNWTASKPVAGFTADQNWNGNNGADTGAIYAISKALPGFEETTSGLTNSDSFSLLTTSMPEFVSGEETVQNNPITEGEIETLKYISNGQYLLMEINHSVTNRSIKEIVKVSSVNFIWNSDNNILRVEVKCERGQLGTQAFDFESALRGDSNWEHASIRYIGPSLKFPTGTKGSTMQIKLKNQEGSVESISFVYRTKSLK